MLTKILIITMVVTIASCSDRHYLKRPHDHKEYKHSYEHRIQVQEPSSEEYKPEQHAFSSQSLVHQGQVYEASHETLQAPYQYQVNENSDESNQEPIQKYHYPQQEVQTVRERPHKTYYPEAVRAQAYHASEGHKPYHSESQEAHKAYYTSEGQKPYHPEPQEHKAYQPETHEAPKIHYQSQEPIYAPEHHASHDHDEPIDYYAYPKYQYEYKVEDPHTGDNKFQHEVRDGDVVKGVYGLHEPDGSIRTVEYSSDKHHGFSAIVKHSAPGQHVHIETHHQNEEHDQN